MLNLISKIIITLILIGFFQVNQSVLSQEIVDNQSELEDKVLKIIRENPEVIKEALEQYQAQEENRFQQRRSAFLQLLKDNPIEIIQDSPKLGSEDLQIVLVEFSDFQCSFCAESNQVLKEFIAKHKNEVTLVYKHLPLSDIHTEAMGAAKAARAAQKQGKFWEYHDALFENQNRLGEQLYIEIAKQLNLDLKKFNLDREQATEAILKDIELAKSLNISGTPFFIMKEGVFAGTANLVVLERMLEETKNNITSK